MIWRTLDDQYQVEWDDSDGHAIRFFDATERQKEDDATVFNVHLRRRQFFEAELLPSL